MNRQPMKRKTPLNRFCHPLWIPTIGGPLGLSRPINHMDAVVSNQRARIVIALTLAMSVSMNTFADSHTQQSSVSRMETPLPSTLEILGTARSSASDVFLPASEAFALQLGAVTAESITVYWDIADGYYLYRDKFQFALSGDTDQQVLREAYFPAGQSEDDPSFGQVEVFHHFVQAVIPWRWDASSTSEITLEIAYQGCADQGLCYPPVSTALTLERPGIDR